jgi:hypothetical protein
MHCKSKNAFVFAILLGSTSWLISVTHANAIEEMSLEAKVQASDIVVLARVESTVARCARKSSCANLHVLHWLKGEREDKDVVVLFNGDLAEDNPLCCEMGKSYLLFLRHVGDGYYVSVNGMYGAYSTDGSNAW